MFQILKFIGMKSKFLQEAFTAIYTYGENIFVWVEVALPLTVLYPIFAS